MPRILESGELADQLTALPGWSGDPTALRAAYAFPTFLTAISAVDQVAAEAEEMDHHPDIDVRWRTLRFTLSTHSAGGVTQLDVELAHRIATIARELGGSVAEPGVV